MDGIAPPPHPPPPSLPPGWKAIWNDQYRAWFYVNEHTKTSQWELPTDAAQPEPAGPPIQMPQGPPPAYQATPPFTIPPAGSDEQLKPPVLGQTSSNPFRKSPGPESRPSSSVLYPEKEPPKPDTSGDEELARRLQAEEDEQNRRPQRQSQERPPAGTGAAGDYYGTSPGSRPAQQAQSPTDEARGKSSKRNLLLSLFGRKNGQSSSPINQHGGPPRPPQMYGGPPHPGYGGPFGGYSQQPMYGGPPPVMYGSRPSRPGMGAGTGLALGAGAGLLGGAFLNHEMNDSYRDGYEDARDDYQEDHNNHSDGNDYNDDYGGGDFNGGDFDGGDW